MPIPPLEPNPNCILHTPLPSTWVTRFAHLFNPSGRVLDLACGAGRHSRYLLEFGYKVYALDRDTRGVLDLVSNPNFFLHNLMLKIPLGHTPNLYLMASLSPIIYTVRSILYSSQS